MSAEATPRTVRIAGVLTALQATVGFVFVVALLIRASGSGPDGVVALSSSATYGQAGYYALLSSGVMAAGIGLWLGKHWARTPALLLQLLLLGVAWFAIGPSGAPLIGFAIAAPAIAVLWCLFNRRSRGWSFYAGAAPDSSEAPNTEQKSSGPK